MAKVTTKKSILDFEDCEEVFSAAVNNERGVAVPQESHGHATAYMQRLNTYRVKLRQASEATYPVGHELRGKSPYDDFIIRRDPENSSRVLVQPKVAKTVKIEAL